MVYEWMYKDTTLHTNRYVEKYLGTQFTWRTNYESRHVLDTFLGKN
jgi:hypothetical protein